MTPDSFGTGGGGRGFGRGGRRACMHAIMQIKRNTSVANVLYYYPPFSAAVLLMIKFDPAGSCHDQRAQTKKELIIL